MDDLVAASQVLGPENRECGVEEIGAQQMLPPTPQQNFHEKWADDWIKQAATPSCYRLTQFALADVYGHIAEGWDDTGSPCMVTAGERDNIHITEKQVGFI